MHRIPRSPQPATRNVLIDTDGATDDMRAITLMLADARIEVLGITCVDGVLPPEDCSTKVLSLLKTFHHEGIPVGRGEERSLGEVKGRNFCRNFDWGEDNGGLPVLATGAREIYQDIIQHSKGPFTLVCLGPLTNIAENLALLKGKVDKIIWYCNGDSSRGQNIYCDRDAIPLVEGSGIPMERISNPDIPGVYFDETLLEEIGGIESRYARHLYSTHGNGVMRKKIREGFYGLWDELAPVYLFNPEYFRKNGGSLIEPSDQSGIRDAVLTMLEEGYPDSRGFSGFPEEEGYIGEASGSWRGKSLKPMERRNGEPG